MDAIKTVDSALDYEINMVYLIAVGNQEKITAILERESFILGGRRPAVNVPS